MKIRIYSEKYLGKFNTEYRVYLSFTENNKRFFVFTGMTAEGKIGNDGYPKNETNWRKKNQRLNNIIADCEEWLEGHYKYSWEDKKRALKKIITGKEAHEKTLAGYVSDFAKRNVKSSTAALYMSTSRKVAAYDDNVTPDAVDKKWLEGFEDYMRTHYDRTPRKDGKSPTGMTTNGIAIQMRNLRAVFNWLVDEGITEKYPFRKYKIRQEATRKRSLTPEELITLRDYPVEPWQEKYRDMFMLMFYLIGINIGDLCEATGVSHGRLVYNRKKTGRLYDIEVPDEAMEIIRRYRGKSHLLNILEEVKDYHTFMQHMNRALKKIGPSRVVPDRLGKMRKIEYIPLFPDLSTYWARHTWASIAARLDIPTVTIGKALGHADALTADIYVDFDYRKVDKANRQVLDYIRRGAASPDEAPQYKETTNLIL